MKRSFSAIKSFFILLSILAIVGAGLFFATSKVLAAPVCNDRDICGPPCPPGEVIGGQLSCTPQSCSCVGGSHFCTQWWTCVVAPPPPTSAIQVNSINSVTLQPIASSWTFPLYPSADPCVSGCSGVNVSYSNQPTGIYTLAATPGSAGPLYSLRGVENHFAAREDHPGFFSFAYWENIFAKFVKAVTVGPCIAGSTSCSLTLGANSSIVFTPEWDPIAQMAVLPTPLSVTDTAPGTLTISNTGAPGSQLNWFVGSITYASGSNWLSVSPAVPVLGGASQPVTVSYTGTLPPGSYRATIVFTGTSSPTGVVVPQKSVTVNLVVGSSALTCAPLSQTVNTAQSANLSASGGAGSYTWSAPGGIPASGSGSLFGVNYGTLGAHSVTVTDGASTASCNVNVIDLRCNFTANPGQILFRESSTLSWMCVNAVSCSIDQGIGSVNPVSGSTQVAPASSTRYTLNCTGAGVSTFTAAVDVNVGPGLCEVHPYDPRCPH